MMLTGEELLAGSQLSFTVEIPNRILRPQSDTPDDTPDTGAQQQVRLKPLKISDLQLISKAAKDNENLTAVLMVQKALVEPELSVPEVGAMHVGLLQYLLHQVNEISGINANEDTLNQAVEAPIARAAYLLAKAFGWTPQQVNDMTLGQVLLNLHLLREHEDHVAAV